MIKNKLLTIVITLSIGASLLTGCGSTTAKTDTPPTTKIIEKSVAVDYNLSPEQILNSYTEDGMRQFKVLYPSQVFRDYALKEIGKVASDFELKNIKGETVKLSSFKGKKVVIEFTKYTCSQCKKSAPFIEQLAKQDKDTVYITIFPKDTKADVERFYTETNLPVNQNAIAGKDNGDKMTLIKDYALTSVPTLIFIDETGKISLTSIGNFDDKELQSSLNVAFKSTKLYDMVKKEKVEVDKNGKVIKTIPSDNSKTADGSNTSSQDQSNTNSANSNNGQTLKTSNTVNTTGGSAISSNTQK